MRNARNVLLVSVVLVLAVGWKATAAADTLQLKNGIVVQGKYLGGSERTVQFERAGNRETYLVADILSVTFAETPAASPAVSGSSSSSTAPNTAVYSAPSTAAANSAPQVSPSVASTPTDSTKGSTVTIPAGTRVMVRMIDRIDSETNHVGDGFHASLESDLITNGVTVASKGADVYGRLADAQEAGRVTGKPQLTLELTDISIHGRLQPIVTGEYELVGESRTASTAKRAGGGAAIGAIIGAIAGGGKGAAIGAGVGAGVGTATNAARGAEEVHVPSETVIEFRLAQPLATQLN